MMDAQLPTSEGGTYVLQTSKLDTGQRYLVEGLGSGRWRPLWWDRSELVLTDVPAGRIKALVGLADLTQVGPAHLRYAPPR
jgi:hypothetical protein